MGQIAKHQFNFDHRGKSYRGVAFQVDRNWVGYIDNVDGINCQEETIGALIKSFRECLDLLYGDKHTAENFKLQVQGAIQVIPKDDGKEFAVHVPFYFGDGDMIVIGIRDEGEQWVLTDRGHTRQHLSYHIDYEILDSESYKKVFDLACSRHDIENIDGELRREIQTTNCVDSFYNFVQGLLQIIHVVKYKEMINK